MLKKIVMLCFILHHIAFTAESKTLKIKDKDVKKLGSMMAGVYNNETQVKENASFPSMNLYIKPILKDEINGVWYYVEQENTTTPGNPTSQKVYYLYKLNDTTIITKVYEIKNPAQYIGGWKDEQKLTPLTIDSLIEGKGCEIALHKRKQQVYSGSTPWGGCGNLMKGADYTSTEVVIYKKKLVIWERGWSEKGKQVWGSNKGGYSFIKKKK